MTGFFYFMLLIDGIDCEANFYKIVVILGVRFGDHHGVVDRYSVEFQGGWREGHGHAVIFVGVDGRVFLRSCGGAIPCQIVDLVGGEFKSQFSQFHHQGIDAVGLLDFQGLQAGEMEWDAQAAAGNCHGLCQVGLVGEVVFEIGGFMAALFESGA